MLESDVLQSIVVRTTANELVLIAPERNSIKVLLKAGSGIAEEWLPMFAASPALYGQLWACNGFLEQLKQLCDKDLQLQIEIVQNAAQQAMRLALGETVETDKRLN